MTGPSAGKGDGNTERRGIDADEDALRAAAAHWDTVADAVDRVAVSCSRAARLVQHGSGHDAGGAFGELWARYTGDGKAFLPATATACRRQAAALRDYAGIVARAKRNAAPDGLASATALEVERDMLPAVADIVWEHLVDDAFSAVEFAAEAAVVRRLIPDQPDDLPDGGGHEGNGARRATPANPGRRTGVG